MKPDTINVHIDHLVVEGSENLDKKQIGAAVQSELKRLISDQGLHASLHQSSAIESVAGKPITASTEISARGMGYQIANSIYRGLK